MEYRLKIGLVPEIRNLADFETRKGIFEPAKGVANKNRAVRYLREHFADELTSFTDLEWLNDRGVLYDTADVGRVVRYLRDEHVDAIFLINCNFGNEEACGRLASELRLPVLLWGPQDMEFAADGERYTDAQCGLFAVSKQLRRRGVPFSYIENCPVESETFAEGFRRFLSAACMVKNFRGLTVTQVGTRLDPFQSVMYNELELTEQFGMNLHTVNLAQAQEIFHRVRREREPELQKELSALKERYDVGGLDDETLLRMLAFVPMYREIFEKTGADVLASECWTAMPLAFGANPCLAMSLLYDQGYAVACESDLHGAITNALLLCAARGRSAPAFGEFTVRHPQDPNAELLWHCGPFPESLRDPASRPRLFRTKPSFKARDGAYTIARFQGDRGRYTLLGGEYETTDGPHTFGTYMWARFHDWPRIERKLIEGPYIHHMCELPGRHAAALAEFCKFIPDLTFDPLEG